MYDELPQDLPFTCPHKGCDEAKSSSHKLLLHYGIYHKRSLTLYRRHPSYLNYERSASGGSSKDCSGAVPKVELPEALSSKTNKLKAVVSPYNPLSEKEKSSGPSRNVKIINVHLFILLLSLGLFLISLLVVYSFIFFKIGFFLYDYFN